VGS
jgi:hypothetical protein